MKMEVSSAVVGTTTLVIQHERGDSTWPCQAFGGLLSCDSSALATQAPERLGTFPAMHSRQNNLEMHLKRALRCWTTILRIVISTTCFTLPRATSTARSLINPPKITRYAAPTPTLRLASEDGDPD